MPRSSVKRMSSKSKLVRVRLASAPTRPRGRPLGSYSIARAPVSSYMGRSVGTQTQHSAVPVPPKISKKLRYVQTFQLSTGTLGVFGTAKQFRMNSCFDPNYTDVTGDHQPYCYDTYSAQYANYTVKNCKAKLIWTTIGGTAEVCCAAQVNVNNTGIALAGQNVDAVTERSSASTCVLSASGNTRTREQNINVNIAKMFGKPANALVIEDSYGALISANPTQVCYLSIAVASYSAVGAEGVSCQVILDYDVEFNNAIDLAQS